MGGMAVTTGLDSGFDTLCFAAGVMATCITMNRIHMVAFKTYQSVPLVAS